MTRLVPLLATLSLMSGCFTTVGAATGRAIGKPDDGVEDSNSATNGALLGGLLGFTADVLVTALVLRRLSDVGCGATAAGCEN